MVSPDLYRPLRGTEDIPIHRDSIGGMGISDAPLMPFVPYVYRGTGYDQFPETETPVSIRATKKAKPKPRPKRRRTRKPKSRPEPPRYRALYYWPQYVPPAAPPIRPAEGWKPMTGADMDDLLEGL